MAEKDKNYDASLDDVEEQIRKLEKEKEDLERRNREKQAEQRLRQLREDVSTLKTGTRLSAGTHTSNRRSQGDNREVRRESEDHTGDHNISGGATSLEDSHAQLRALQQSILNTSGNSSFYDDGRDHGSPRSSDDAEDDVMSPSHKQALRANRDVLVENMTPDDIFNDLISKHILTNSDVSRIKDKNTVEAVNEELLNVLMRRSDRAFHIFVASLRRTLQGSLANRLEPGVQQRNKRKRRTGEINVNLDCERIVPSSKKSNTCKCQEVEEQILIMARGAFANLRRRDGTPAAFEQFKKEAKQTNDLIKESMEIMNTLKILCRHGDITDMSSGSICFTIRCASFAACQELWKTYETGILLKVCQEGLVTPSLLKWCSASEIHLSLRISRLEYLICALELAYRERQVLQHSNFGPVPVKRRLRQKIHRIHCENSHKETTNSSSSYRGKAFQEIPVNIMHPAHKIIDHERHTNKCCKEGIFKEESFCHTSPVSIEKSPWAEHLMSKSAINLQKSSKNRMWLRSQDQDTFRHRSQFSLSPAVFQSNDNLPHRISIPQDVEINLSAENNIGNSIIPSQGTPQFCPYNLRLRTVDH